MDSSNSENASSRTNMFEDTPDSVFSDLAQSYNKPGSTGHFRAEYARTPLKQAANITTKPLCSHRSRLTLAEPAPI